MWHRLKHYIQIKLSADGILYIEHDVSNKTEGDSIKTNLLKCHNKQWSV